VARGGRARAKLGKTVTAGLRRSLHLDHDAAVRRQALAAVLLVGAAHWSEKGRVKQLATGFKGPADFSVVPGGSGSMTVVVPDLVQSQLRFIQLRQ
jgi:hypothetical protein